MLTRVDLVVVLPTLPTTATSLMCGLCRKNVVTERARMREMRVLKSLMSIV